MIYHQRFLHPLLVSNFSNALWNKSVFFRFLITSITSTRDHLVNKWIWDQITSFLCIFPTACSSNPILEFLGDTLVLPRLGYLGIEMWHVRLNSFYFWCYPFRPLFIQFSSQENICPHSFLLITPFKYSFWPVARMSVSYRVNLNNICNIVGIFSGGQI